MDAMEVFSRSSCGDDDEEALKWAAIEKLPTYLRIRRGILKEEQGEAREIDIRNLGLLERRHVLERLVKIAEDDNEKFLLKLRDRIERLVSDLKEAISSHCNSCALEGLQTLKSLKLETDSIFIFYCCLLSIV